MKQQIDWGQKRELTWLEGIGRHHFGGMTGSRYVGMSADQRRQLRVRCLEGYISSLKARSRWWRSANIGALRARAEDLLENARRELQATAREATQGVG